MKKLIWIILLAASWNSAYAAESEGKWPCDQVYTEKLSLSTIWQGGELGERVKTWWEDEAAIDEVNVLLNPLLDEAAVTAEVNKFAAAQPTSERRERLLNLFAGLYDRTVDKRLGQLESILRFAARQDQLVAAISERSSRLREMRKAETVLDDPNYVALQTELDWYVRIFDERLGLTEYICEVPILLVQRLGFASRAIAEALKN